MSIRIKIANWLAPELVRERDNWEWLSNCHLSTQVDALSEGRRLSRALRNIAALRTPSCAHIGRRMADIAETALSHSHSPASEEKGEVA